MKIIDLLNKIANGEEIPNAIKWGNHTFEWLVYEYKAKGELGEPTLLDYLSQCPDMLNDEIITLYKIEESQEHKIPEKLDLGDYTEITSKNDMKYEMFEYIFNKNANAFYNKINEIIDCLEEIK